MPVTLKHDDQYQGEGAEAVKNWVLTNNSARFSSEAYRAHEEKTESNFVGRIGKVIAVIASFGGNARSKQG